MSEKKVSKKNSDMKKCPFCANMIKKKAIKCQYCGEFLDNKIKKQCPFCLNDIDDGTEKCPYCDEVLIVKKNRKKAHIFNKYSIDKRVDRKEFGIKFIKAIGWILLGLIGVGLLVELFVAVGLNRDFVSYILSGIWAFYILYLYLYKYLLLKIKRLHDLGLSGWWVILTYLPVLNLVSFVLFLSLKSKD